MPGKRTKVRPQKRAGKSRNRVNRVSAKPRAARARGKRPRMKKSAARQAIKAAVAKRKKTMKPSRPSRAPRTPGTRPARKSRKPLKGRASPRKAPAAKKPRAQPKAKKAKKLPAKRKASPIKRPASKKPRKLQKAESSRKQKKKPALRQEEPQEQKAPEKKPIPRAEVNGLLSDAYARHLVIESGGEYALEIVKGFTNNISDEELSKKLKIKISDVRATLNKLHSLGVVEYTRHKDSETGWFSYFWSLNIARMKSWISDRMDEDHRRLDFTAKEHYYCPRCGGSSIHDFVSASDFGFRCPTCSSALDFLSQEKADELFPARSFRKPLL